MALLNFKYGLQSALPGFSHDNDGTIFVTTDTSRLHIVLPDKDKYVCTGDFELVDYSGTEDTPLQALNKVALKKENILYIAVNGDTTGMYRYNGSSFVAISNSTQIADLQQSITTLQTDLANLTTEVGTKATKTEVSQLKSDLEEADTTLQGNIDNKADKSTVEALDAAYKAKDTELASNISTLSGKVDGKAPTNHADGNDTYGKGTKDLYGHVKLSDVTNGTSGENDGIAATPAAVKSVNEAAATAQVKANEAYNLASEVQQQANTNKTSINNLAEKDTELNNAIEALQQKDIVIEGNINTLVNKDKEIDAALALKATTAALNAETEARAAADSTHSSDISSLKTNKLDAFTFNEFKTEQVQKNTALQNDINTRATQDSLNAEIEARTAGDEVLNTALTTLEGKIGNLSNIMNFLGVTTAGIDTEPKLTQIDVGGETITAQKGDVVIKGNAEFVFDGTEWVEIGDVTDEATAISNLTSRVESLESWKTSHTTEFSNLSNTVSGHTATLAEHSTAISTNAGNITKNSNSIDNLITVLTWGTFPAASGQK